MCIFRLHFYGSTALMYAVDGNYLSIVKYLVSKGADLSIKDNTSYTAFILAILNENLNIVKYLIGKVNLAKENEKGEITKFLRRGRNPDLQKLFEKYADKLDK